MGTTGTVRVFAGDKELLCFQKHCDGYPDGLGREVADFCASKRVVNGISLNHRQSAIANGAGCLAAQLLAHFKDGVGDIYVEAPGEPSNYGYEYIVKCPTFQQVDAAKETGNRDGLPIVVEAFHVSGGYLDKPLVREAVVIPDGDLPEEEEDDDD